MPIDSNNYYTLENAGQPAVSNNGYTNVYAYPPYGWPISANILTSSNGDSYVSYCVAKCTETPNSMTTNSPYPPVGPAISNVGDIVNYNDGAKDLGFGVSYNGTATLLAHVYSHTSSYQQDVQGAQVGVPSIPTSSGAELYTELLNFNLNLNNYTTLSLGANASYTCYINVKVTTGGTPCDTTLSDPQYKDPLGNMYAPIAEMPSAFSYAEAQGSPNSYFNFQSVVSSVIPTGKITKPSDSQITSSSQQTSQSASNLGSATTTAAAQAGALNRFTYINSSVGGYLLVPYSANYILTEKWDNLQGTATGDTPPGFDEVGLDPCPQFQFAIGGAAPPVMFLDEAAYLAHKVNLIQDYIFKIPSGTDVSKMISSPGSQFLWAGIAPNPAPFCKVVNYKAKDGESDSTQQCGVYSDAAGFADSVGYPNASIEGGPTYLQSYSAGTETLLQPNVSDKNLILPSNLDYNLLSNRLFGELYINETVNAQGPLSTPSLINASHLQDYKIIEVNQVFNGQTYPGYALGQSATVIPPVSDLQSDGSNSGGYYYNPSGILDIKNNLTLSNTIEGVTFTPSILNEYELARYLTSQLFNISPSEGHMGYHRFVITYVDRFNNTLYVPVAVDFANTVTISFTATPTIDPLNSNKTVVDVTGNAISYVSTLNSESTPLTAGANIYIYYGTNINYYNASLSPGSAAYYQYAQRCAFASNSVGCVLADPLATTTQGTAGPAEAGTINFATDYNSVNDCPAQPNSLLSLGNTINCNIFGAYSLPETGTTTSSNGGSGSGTEYCIPTYANGNGIFSSQLGLIAIAPVQSDGSFNAVFTACGTRVVSLEAAYYGYPGRSP